MKKNLILAACALLLVVAGCKNKNNEPEQPQTNNETVVVLTGTAARPSWTVSEDYDYSSSMTAIVQVDLSQSYPDAVDGSGKIVNSQIVNDDDLLAAFLGDECVGVASPEEGLFFLYIAGREGMQTVSTVTLRYYSAELKNLFEAKEALEFQNDERIGTVDTPFVPKFTLVKE